MRRAKSSNKRGHSEHHRLSLKERWKQVGVGLGSAGNTSNVADKKDTKKDVVSICDAFAPLRRLRLKAGKEASSTNRAPGSPSSGPS